jgi:tetratricopeptide (TPR) repeat protein
MEESIIRFEEAIRLSPHDPWRWGFFSYRSLAHIFMRQYEAAVEWAKKALRDPNCQYWARAHLVSALGHLDRIDQSQAAVGELLRQKPEFSCSFARKHLFYIKNSVQIDHYLDGLRKAGLSE